MPPQHLRDAVMPQQLRLAAMSKPAGHTLPSWDQQMVSASLAHQLAVTHVSHVSTFIIVHLPLSNIALTA